MYQQRSNRFRSSSRPSWGSVRSNGNGGGARRSSFGGGRSRFGAARRGRRSFDPSLLVKKAEAFIAPEEYKSTHTFSEFEIPQQLKDNIVARGYTTPTPIQDQTIPHLLAGRDVVGIANTGTGKTAAFLIPLLTKISQNRAEKVLIVAPTRELAVQIQDECDAFARSLGIYSALCIGGVNMYRQKQNLRRNPNIVIGTPGRLKDLKQQNCLQFATFNTVVLDEVDRMLDMGFIRDVEYIVSHLPKVRQSLFFSATLSPNVTGVMNTFLTDPITISVKTQETALNVDQDVVRIQGGIKIEILHDLLIKDEFDKVLIFGRTKWGIQKLADELEFRGFKVAALHGNKNQNQRQRALDDFKQNKIHILIATDLASRGLDIDDVTHVINYDLPETYEDYVHRIGRTGRANKKGSAISFID